MAMKYKWTKTGNGAADNLGAQLEKIFRGASQGSIDTKWRYVDGCERFVKYVANEFKLKKIQNIQDKHLEAYARHMKAQGNADKYIKTDLSAIRYLHRQIPQVKCELMDAGKANRACGLGSTPDGRADRSWTEKELSEMKNKAIELGRNKIAEVMEAARSTGMRIDEAASLRRSEVEAALRDNVLHLTNTKNGRPRDIPLSDRAKACLAAAVKEVSRGGYAFCPPDHKVHQFEKSIQNFIYNHRDKFQDIDRTGSGHNLTPEDRGALTFHGLRHTFAREEVESRLESGMSREQAYQEVSELVGHSREEITFIYTAGK